MRNIKLTDGTVYPVDRCGATLNELMINVTSGDDLLDLVMEFGVPAKVARIEHWFDGTDTDHVVYEGYTALTAASNTGTGVMIMLQKGAT